MKFVNFNELFITSSPIRLLDKQNYTCHLVVLSGRLSNPVGLGTSVAVQQVSSQLQLSLHRTTSSWVKLSFQRPASYFWSLRSMTMYQHHTELCVSK